LSFWKRKKEPACSSGSWKNKVPSFLPLLAGLILTLLAIFAARQRISAVERDIMGKAAPTEIVVATNLIPKGALFSLENLSKRSVPSAGTSRRNIPAPDFELLLGARTKVEISDGEPVLWTDVEEPIDVDKFSLKIAKGRRAITIDADMRASFSGLLRPGDHVDLLRKRKDARGFTPLLFHVPVLAVDSQFLPLSSREDGSGIGTITVAVTPNEAILLSAATQEGEISWLLRNPADHGRQPKGKSMSANASSPVEIWKGGIRERKPPAAFEKWELE
jgi:Flp pilus assembly protein CpaB